MYDSWEYVFEYYHLDFMWTLYWHTLQYQYTEETLSNNLFSVDK